ncbi:MAG: Wzz/FepE/Etk N-terminal domain-containing protein [Burkholderiales bacterium]
MDEEGSSKDFREYLAILRRHAVQIVGVIVALAAVAIAVATGLPPVYRSTATILVQEQEIPPDLVRSTITSFADERIQVISQQVMTRAVLLQLVDKYGLYEKYRDRDSNEAIVERMRKDIKLTTVDASISDRSSGRRVNATIAFELSYDSPHPESAQKVVEDLVALFLQENVKARQQSAAETTAFLAQEAERLGKQIQETEAKLADFKRRYAGRTPESAAANLQLAERTESELLRIDREMSMLQDRKFSLEAQLPLIKPNVPLVTTAGTEKILTPNERLRALQAQYATSSAAYGADHPDIRRMQREIAALKAEVGGSDADGNAAERKRLETELAALKERYSDDHPDVQKLKRSIAALNSSNSLAAVRGSARSPANDLDQQRPDNPAYIALTSQLESTRRELAQLAALREDLRAKQRTYDSRLLQIPEIEREYRDLTRDYDNAQTRYREVRAKQMQAEVALELEKDRKAERFALSEPPLLPQRPASPNRLRVALIGLVASLGGGIGIAWLRDLLNPAVKGPLELARIARVPVLTAIPYIETRRERAVKRRRVIGCSHRLHKPRPTSRRSCRSHASVSAHGKDRCSPAAHSRQRSGRRRTLRPRCQ